MGGRFVAVNRSVGARRRGVVKDTTTPVVPRGPAGDVSALSGRRRARKPHTEAAASMRRARLYAGAVSTGAPAVTRWRRRLGLPAMGAGRTRPFPERRTRRWEDCFGSGGVAMPPAATAAVLPPGQWRRTPTASRNSSRACRRVGPSSLSTLVAEKVGHVRSRGTRGRAPGGSDKEKSAGDTSPPPPLCSNTPPPTPPFSRRRLSLAAAATSTSTPRAPQ